MNYVDINMEVIGTGLYWYWAALYEHGYDVATYGCKPELDGYDPVLDEYTPALHESEHALPALVDMNLEYMHIDLY